MRWIIPEPLVPRQEDRRLGERDWNNVKVSYGCTRSAASIINSHNKKILENQPSNTTAECNCRVKDSCPLQGKCQTENVVYLAQVTNTKNSERKCYIGLTERTFKDRFYKHRNSLRHRSKANSTELSKYIWNLKDKSIDEIDVSWSILDTSPPYKNGTRTCQLCLSEKYHIIFHEQGNLLNKRSEILSNCRHQNKFLLCNFKEKPPDN